MNILLVTEPYPPEIRAISKMMQELAEFIYKNGNTIKVLTSMPKRDLIKSNTKLDLPIHRVENGVTVIRVEIPFQNKKGFIYKALSQIIAVPIYYKTLLKYNNKNIDIIIVYSPPLPLGIIGIILKKYYGCKYLLNIQDIFPQNAVDLGIIKNRFIIYFYELLELYIYKHADLITTHTKGCKEFIHNKKHIDSDKLITINNWIDMKKINSINTNNNFNDKYLVPNKFNIIFAGIMGPSQNLTYIIRIAEKIDDLNDIRFLLIGNGYDADKIKALIKEKNLKNVIINDLIDDEGYNLLIKKADLGLISLNPKNTTAVYPGKMLSFMASSLPIFWVFFA